jgi:asparagine synthetase B (glutamine-hydrolysing)
MLGVDPSTEPLPEVEDSLHPLAAFEQALLPALARSPCLVSFSGGRDSSAALATAVRVARREGLPTPVPVTVRFRDAPLADESGYQERLIRRLGLDEWQRLHLSDEFGFVGPFACRHLRRHGVLWPATINLVSPGLAQARGGSLITGVGGDQTMVGYHRGRAITRWALPRRGELLRIGYRRLPARLRGRITRRRRFLQIPWLRPAAREMVAERMAGAPPQPWGRAAFLRWLHTTRDLAGMRHSLALLAADHSVVAVHPFLDARFIGALARLLGRSGVGDRAGTMRTLFGDLLPTELLERPRKALFIEAFCTSLLRGFVGRWGGGHVDPALVDEQALRTSWSESASVPSGWPVLWRTALLAQSAWLGSDDANQS